MLSGRCNLPGRFYDTFLYLCCLCFAMHTQRQKLPHFCSYPSYVLSTYINARHTMKWKSLDAGANKESYGHQSVLTLWAKNDGKPSELANGASEEERVEWEKAMTEWALKGAADFVKYQTLRERDASLLKQRVDIGRENAILRKNIAKKPSDQTKARLEADLLLIHIKTSKSLCESMERDSCRLIAKRMILDMERRSKKLDMDECKDASLLKQRLGIGKENAKIRKQIAIQHDDQSRARLEVDRLLLQIETSKSLCESMERDSLRLIARRTTLDIERSTIKLEMEACKFD